MRLVTFEVTTRVGPVERIGALDPGQAIVDLTAAVGAEMAGRGVTGAARLAAATAPPDMLALIEMGETGLEAARRGLAFAAEVGDRHRGPLGEQLVYRRETVRLRAPLPRPRSLRHVPPARPGAPVSHQGNHLAILGPEDDLTWPAFAARLDFEPELGIVIGRGGRDIPADDGDRHVFGYTVLNDWSARDEVAASPGPTRGQSLATSIGPCLTTADEIDPRRVVISVRVNDEPWSEGDTGAARWTVGQVVAQASRGATLHPGDLLGSGGVGGGSGLALARRLRPGDVVELSIEGLGALRSRVIRDDAPPASR